MKVPAHLMLFRCPMSKPLPPTLMRSLSTIVTQRLPPNKRFVLVVLEPGDPDVRYLSTAPRIDGARVLEEVAAKLRASVQRPSRPKTPVITK